AASQPCAAPLGFPMGDCGSCFSLATDGLGKIDSSRFWQPKAFNLKPKYYIMKNLKCQIAITRTEECIIIDAPYSNYNNKIFRSRGGKFEKGRGWIFPSLPAVEEMIDNLW